jgi:hypothetical protein
LGGNTGRITTRDKRKKKVMKVIILLFNLLFGRSKKSTSFKIKKGAHKSSYSLTYTDKKSFSFFVKFDETCVYKTVDATNQEDVNKLIGISDGFSHTKNSARFGWRYLNGKLEILGYTHFNGKFNFEKICDLEIGKEYQCDLVIGEDYKFSVAGKTISMDRFPKKSGFNYYLWPYFGGNETAPHDIEIKVYPFQ